MRGVVAVAAVAAILLGCAPMRVVKAKRPRKATVTRRVRRPRVSAQQQRAAALNELFERDMRVRDGLAAEWPGQ